MVYQRVIQHRLGPDPAVKITFHRDSPVAHCIRPLGLGTIAFLFVGEETVNKLKELISQGAKQLQVGSVCTIAGDSEGFTYLIMSPNAIASG